ncbi:unnamed protein product [Acanthosepion pharaonis]|uniref:Uncharacterized protein n=1 Tax=Acanthosepion pharaonis TaxID=158019 RepID=A0A812D9Z7_ACAPH|nr:unnamed protein product [Sepia pharaonis]
MYILSILYLFFLSVNHFIYVQRRGFSAVYMSVFFFFLSLFLPLNGLVDLFHFFFFFLFLCDFSFFSFSPLSFFFLSLRSTVLFLQSLSLWVYPLLRVFYFNPFTRLLASCLHLSFTSFWPLHHSLPPTLRFLLFAIILSLPFCLILSPPHVFAFSIILAPHVFAFSILYTPTTDVFVFSMIFFISLTSLLSPSLFSSPFFVFSLSTSLFPSRFAFPILLNFAIIPLPLHFFQPSIQYLFTL